MANRWGKLETMSDFISWAPKSMWIVTVAMKLKDTCSLEEKLWQISKNQRHHFANKGVYSQSYGFSSIMYGCENWTIKKVECQRTDASQLWYWRRLLRVLWATRKSNQSVLKEINQSWIVLGRTDAEAEAPILWPPYAKNWLTGKDPDAGKDWRQEEGMTEFEVVGWHRRLNGHEFE